MTDEGKTPTTVLYVEDDDTTRIALAMSLSRRIEKVLVANNGATGLATFHEHAPDIVVTDLAMPEMNGLTMARAIKAARPETQIIVTTAHSDTSYFLEAIEVGIDAYVLKPVHFASLFAAIDKCFAVVDHARQTARHHAERERLVGELQEALSKVKLLAGLLPICAHCKKIRDDKGYWQQLESYLSSHSEAAFSHSICPNCLVHHYGDFVESESVDKD